MNYEHIPGMTDAEVREHIRRQARQSPHIESADPADDASMPWGRIVATALLVAAVIIGLLFLSGCGASPARAGGERDDGPRAIVEMTNDGWVCTNCNELIPIGPDDRPLEPIGGGE